MNENKTSKYLKYAIGEIILVVIGILIALQINNWNEEKKVNSSINSHLIILKQNLKEDQSQLKSLRQNMKDNIQFANSLLSQIKTIENIDPDNKKYLLKLILEFQFSPNTNAIETITQSNEIPNLQQDLQTAILNYYALIEKTKEREHISNTQIQSKYESYININYPEIFQKDNNFEFTKSFYKDDPRPITPIDANKFLSDKILEALIISRYYQIIELEKFYDDLLHSSNAILELINV